MTILELNICNIYVIFAQVERNLNAIERNLNVIWTQSERFAGIHVHITVIYVHELNP